MVYTIFNVEIQKVPTLVAFSDEKRDEAMQWLVEQGVEVSNADLDEYPIKKGEKVRVVDLTAYDGEIIEIYGAQLPDTYVKGNKLVSDASGKLVTGGSTAQYFEITKVIPNVKGVEVKVVAK